MRSVILGVVGAIALVAAMVGLTWISLVANRPMAKYAKETDRQVYENSVAHQQGANNSIGQDCANMQSNTGAQKLAFARFVLSDAAAYSGDRGLSDASQACVQEARAALATAQ